MTTKPKAQKFRTRRGSLTQSAESTHQARVEAAEDAAKEGSDAASQDAGQTAAQETPEQTSVQGAEQAPGSAQETAEKPARAADEELAAIRKEGLTGRQLRLARRMAQKHGLAVTSDFDAVRQLRRNGVDPFSRSNIVELVSQDAAARPAEGAAATGGALVPQTEAPATAVAAPAAGAVAGAAAGATPSAALANAAVEIRQIQQDIARRRRAKMAGLMARLAVFVLLPTVLVGYYYFAIATPMYATKTEFVIEVGGTPAAGMGGLFAGTSMANQQDSITVQSHLSSREVMVRLSEEEGFKDHFASDAIDPVQRLEADASNEDAFKLYQNYVKIGYDPTEGIVRLETIAADPETSQRFAEALVGYAEERINNLTQRIREDQMSGARDSYESAEASRQAALTELVRIQTEAERIDPLAESSALLGRITTLESQRDILTLELQSLLDNRRPNEARTNAVRADIERIDAQIAALRSEMTDGASNGVGLTEVNAQLRQAEENYAARVTQVQLALQQLETAQIEANRQSRFLLMGVRPVAPDEPTYPRAFENTLLAFLIFAGIYLMISLTASVLREQVSS